MPTLDVGAFAERILLFARNVLESAKLLELPAIVAACGYKGTCELIETGALNILSDICPVGESAASGSDLPPDAYKLVAIRMSSRDASLSSDSGASTGTLPSYPAPMWAFCDSGDAKRSVSGFRCARS